MPSLSPCAAERLQPFHSLSPVGQALAAAILLAGALWAIAWAASAPPAFPRPRAAACMTLPDVSSAHAGGAMMRIRFAESASAPCGATATDA